MTRSYFILFISLCLWANARGQEAQAIECPFPNGPDDESLVNCNLYSSCQWSETRCHMKENDEIGYTVISEPEDTGRGFKVQLQKENSYTMFEGDIEFLTFEVIYHEDYHVQFRITDANNARYEPPVELNLPDSPGSDPLYQVTVSDVGTPFSFTITRASTGNIIFDSVGPLTYEDQFIQISTRLASTYLYGFGENTHLTFRHVFDPRNTWAIFARDQIVGTDNMNEYGHHPYYMVIEEDSGIAHSGLFFGSNAMEYSTFLLDDGTPALTFRVIGGIIDMHFFLGSEPEGLNTLYTNMIGRPVFPPYYSLGFQLSRWGYNGTDHVRQVRERTKQYDIPQDIQVLDIDYMYHYRDFTTDPDAWGDLDVLIDELHADNLKVTVILDPGLVVDFDNYPPAERGRQVDAYIKWSDPSLVPDDQPPNTADYMVGYCWPDEKTVYPDFFKPETQDWWVDEIVRFKEVVDFDILWIDMNEPANFGTDTARPWNYPPEEPDWSLKCPYNKYDSPPYPTKTTYTGSTESFRLSDHSLCMSAMLTDGNNTYLMYDVHSIYGLKQTIPSQRAMDTIFPGKRNIILSRSTFPSSGRYAVHWLGDNVSQWPQIHMSIIGMFEFNMFGIPYVGADICGFIDPTTEEMCHRWMEIGAFYPFSRNHNADGNPDQDPGMWPAVAETSKKCLNFRYQYLPYLYGLFHRAHMDGNSVVRPLLNVFPSDLTSRDVDDQFMWGNGLMIAPVLTEATDERDVYFPPSNWYHLANGVLASSGSETVLVSAPIDVILLYVRGGSILPYQDPEITTAESRLNPFGATIAIQDGSASGEIYWDDGESDHDMSNAYFAFLDFSENTLTLTVDNESAYVDELNMNHLNFYGLTTEPSEVTLDDVAIDTWSYDADTQVLSVDIDVPLNQGFVLVLN